MIVDRCLMWVKNVGKTLNFDLLKLFFVSLFCLVLTGCGSGSYPDIQTMFMNIGQSIPSVYHMIVGFAYISGMALILRAVYALKIYGDMRTQMSSQSNLKTPIILFLVGAMLMYLPTARSMMMTTLFAYGDPMPLSYFTANPVWSGQTTQVLLQIVQLVGLIAFVRGWVYLAQTTSHNPGQHTFGKAMTHIIGGILAINIEGTRRVLMGTLGISG